MVDSVPPVCGDRSTNREKRRFFDRMCLIGRLARFVPASKPADAKERIWLREKVLKTVPVDQTAKPMPFDLQKA